MKALRLGCLLASCLLLAMPLIATANVVITGTRVIYQEKDREVTVKLDNAGKQPALVQVWADRGNAKASASNADAPFLITPPIFRIEPGKGQTLRIIFTGEKLPMDRESVFWLNVLDIPPLPREQQDNFVQLAIRSRIKIFYRPAKLAGSQDDSAQGLQWTLRQQGDGLLLQASNPAPYHASMNFAAIGIGGNEYRTDGGMVPPFGTATFKINGLQKIPSQINYLHYESIDDYGAIKILNGTLHSSTSPP
ncbi:molecular chaperone [Vogesella sp. LIG4]|uniref:fimbrial biogenesis chaperone n=1 Tax=Vogesella sp. LIG4 TaxID=1192162 RepID=UPI00082006FB|nr:fimbria/pilus periplasmic chaperone [Vogesella sp. LIG4]SCK16991.1 chaperone protein EcpD [Vogesella sp. LIG4]